MSDKHGKDQPLTAFLQLLALFVFTCGLCFAGKPGATQPKDLASLETVIVAVGLCSPDDPNANDPGLCPDQWGAYVDGDDGVRSVIDQNGGYQFTTDYSRSVQLRTVFIRLDYVGGADYHPGVPDLSGDVLNLPIHLAINWDFYDELKDLEVGSYIEGGMGGTFTVGGIDYRLRWGPADEFGEASPVRVTKTAGGWLIEPVEDQYVRLMDYENRGKWSKLTNHGLFYFPFMLMLTN